MPIQLARKPPVFRGVETDLVIIALADLGISYSNIPSILKMPEISRSSVGGAVFRLRSRKSGYQKLNLETVFTPAEMKLIRNKVRSAAEQKNVPGNKKRIKPQVSLSGVTPAVQRPIDMKADALDLSAYFAMDVTEDTSVQDLPDPRAVPRAKAPRKGASPGAPKPATQLVEVASRAPETVPYSENVQVRTFPKEGINRLIYAFEPEMVKKPKQLGPDSPDLNEEKSVAKTGYFDYQHWINAKERPEPKFYGKDRHEVSLDFDCCVIVGHDGEKNNLYCGHPVPNGSSFKFCVWHARFMLNGAAMPRRK